MLITTSMTCWSPKKQTTHVEEELLKYGQPTKPAERLPTTRVLGLQLQESGTGEVNWSMREPSDVETVPVPLIKRSLFQWCGRATGHYPVASWLRVHCSLLKRLTCNEVTNWGYPLSSELQQRCVALAERLKSHDPVRGVWNAAQHDPSCCTWQVWCDASDIAFGAVLTLDGEAIEDCSWLRKPDDRTHINIAELEAAVQRITLAAKREIKNFKLMTDSKMVAGWLSQLLNNTRRVGTSGLHGRRLDIIDDMVETLGLTTEVFWIPSSENRADQLTRVPKEGLSLARSLPLESPDEVIAAASSTMLSLPSPITSEQMARAQREDAELEITRTVREIACEEEVTAPNLRKVTSQLLLPDGVLCRNLKLPLEGVVTVPVIPGVLQEEAVRVAHVNTGRASWETM